jgi:hypothetical protein
LDLAREADELTKVDTNQVYGGKLVRKSEQFSKFRFFSKKKQIKHYFLLTEEKETKQKSRDL